ncbi:hypothetical protein [Blastococcus sp. SYSU D00813]
MPTLPPRRDGVAGRLRRSVEVGVGRRGRRSVAGHPARDDGPPPPGPGHRDVPGAVGAVDPHALAGQPAQEPARGVAVGVVGADRHDGHLRTAGRQEGGVVVGAAVVRHLQHVGRQVDAPAHQPLLGLCAEVAGEQHAQAAHRHAGDQ